MVGRLLTTRLGPGANRVPPAEPVEEVEPTDSHDPSGTEQPVAEETQPAVEQLSLVTGNSTVETQAPDEPDATPSPAHDNAADDEDFDEPQPRNVRRRPFTSRLLRS